MDTESSINPQPRWSKGRVETNITKAQRTVAGHRTDEMTTWAGVRESSGLEVSPPREFTLKGVPATLNLQLVPWDDLSSKLTAVPNESGTNLPYAGFNFDKVSSSQKS
jgi:hypothetical protein